MRPGDILRHDRFYLDLETGELKRKYLVILARTRADMLVVRLLTSKATGRPQDPPCYHGHPYPGFYLGVPGGALSMKSWVDLRGLEDAEPDEIATLRHRGVVQQVLRLDVTRLSAVLECTAGAEDTTRTQEQAVRDTLAALRAG